MTCWAGRGVLPVYRIVTIPNVTIPNVILDNATYVHAEIRNDPHSNSGGIRHKQNPNRKKGEVVCELLLEPIYNHNYPCKKRLTPQLFNPTTMKER